MMSFKFALELADTCGLETVGEAVYNIRLRVGQLFEVEEYKQLVDEVNSLGVKGDDTVEYWVNKLGGDVE